MTIEQVVEQDFNLPQGYGQLHCRANERELQVVRLSGYPYC